MTQSTLVRYTFRGNSSPFMLSYESSDKPQAFSASKTCLATQNPPRKGHADFEIIKAMCNAFQTLTKAKLWACFGFTVLETPRV